ncbi:phosphate acetyltransferase [Desertifilum sp. FACHB-1129]|uniref:Phosphate acetyltransferase n=1 Tax=Desertifilum tharense IPPAS B-1220 TaxID=1781255 RepID=A0A1E5QN11_9CYAN|nr:MULTISPECIES: phosphate acetyltransferase [Desertifilum]MDA0208584.1 phosphate acetyltransferase [Cyanobacteria bacterium FC1]MBD2312406.1 phosphate acetyltransferase [Desertifilum sp. FACHB-1129]MBD2321189.1 phosphate acetyltransferase [Desertifilum sp. FACHB-866]MBD2331504.1 phosphate acetyltransferase [Desertifilum sp. FACHB-868]OEJ76018.1 phosphate acetyltransferase [Desertifilum tharense IPPAS B-1220]
MLQNLYIAAIAPNSGKSLIVLGLMELLSKRIGRLGFFRPVTRSENHRDNDIELIRSRYPLDVPYEAQYALTREELQHWVADGHYDEILKRIIEKYKALERHCDFIVCEGIDSSEIDSAFVDNFDTRVANHLSAPVLLVGNGQGNTPAEIVDTVRTEREAFMEADCAIAATIVNRVNSGLIETINAQLEAVWNYDDPVFTLPEDSAIARPTIQEIVRAISANWVYGEDSQLNREVRCYKVAAMQLPNFLHHLEEGSLIITPGDRADIVLGCLTALLSESCPNIAGIVLTGGLELAPSIQKLLQGFRWLHLPIVSVATNTYETATQISHVQAEITPDNPRKIASALGLFEAHIDTAKLQACIAVPRSERVTPLMFEYELIERAKMQKQRIVFPEGDEERILLASEILRRRGVAEIVLLGKEGEIREKIATLGLSLNGVQIIDPLRSPWHDEFATTYYNLRRHKGITEDCARDMMHDVSYFGTMMVYKDLADGMVSGAQHTTAHTIRPALEFIRTQPGTSIVSSVFLMCLADRVLVYGDCAVNPNPNTQQLADIAISSAATAQTFGVEPRIAMLSYSTGASGKGADVDKVREATQLVRELRPDLKIEGPIQYDAAVDSEVAHTKLPDSEVAGQATVFIFPDLNAGNNTYKAVQRSANAVAIGPLLQGLRKPVNDLSRGCTVTDIVNTVAITAIQAQKSDSLVGKRVGGKEC